MGPRGRRVVSAVRVRRVQRADRRVLRLRTGRQRRVIRRLLSPAQDHHRDHLPRPQDHRRVGGASAAVYGRLRLSAAARCSGRLLSAGGLRLHRAAAGHPRHVRLHRVRRLAAGDDPAHGHRLADCTRLSQQVQRRLPRCRGVRNDDDATSNSRPRRHRRHPVSPLQCAEVLRAPGKLRLCCTCAGPMSLHVGPTVYISL